MNLNIDTAAACGADAASVTTAATRHTQTVCARVAASVPLNQMRSQSSESAAWVDADSASWASGKNAASSAAAAQAQAPND